MRSLSVLWELKKPNRGGQRKPQSRRTQRCQAPRRDLLSLRGAQARERCSCKFSHYEFPIAGMESDQRNAPGTSGREHSNRHCKEILISHHFLVHITPAAKIQPLASLPSASALVIQNIDTRFPLHFSSHYTISIQPIINISLITEPAAHNKCL